MTPIVNEYHGPATVLLDRAVAVEVYRQGRIETVSMPSPSPSEES